MAKYINPFVDFGFKYLFGREESKPFLIDFLNALLCGEPDFSPIVELDYLDKERSKADRAARGVIYDIHCVTSSGKRFTVEMQNQPQAWFFERMIYYSSKGIVDQGKPGRDWRYDYLPVYCVSFMNFAMPGYEDRFRIDVALCDLGTGKQFTDKLRYFFIQTPLFDKKTPEACVSDLDQWLYNIIHMPTMEKMAFTQQKSIFERLDSVAAYAALTEDERMAYDADVKAYRDMRGQIEYAEARGKAEGIANMIKGMASQGIAIDIIASIAKMTVDKVKKILSSPE